MDVYFIFKPHFGFIFVPRSQSAIHTPPASSTLTMISSAEVPDRHEQGLCLRPGQPLHVPFWPQRSKGTF